MDEIPERIIAFPSHYPGWRLDGFLFRLKTFLSLFGTGLGLMAVGLLIFFLLANSATGDASGTALAFILIFFGAIFLLLSPVAGLCLSMNRGLSGQIRVAFLKEGEGVYRVKVDALSKDKSIGYEERLRMVYDGKRLAKLSLASSKEIYLPYKALRESEISYLHRIANEIALKRAQEAGETRLK